MELSPHLAALSGIAVATSLLMLFSSGLLFILSRHVEFREYQKYWGISWFFLGVFGLLGNISMYLRISGVTDTSVLNILTFLSQVSGYLGPTYLFIGALVMLNKAPHKNYIFIWSILIFIFSYYISFSFDAPDLRTTRYVTRIGLRNFYTSIFVFATAYLTLKHYQATLNKGFRIFSYSLIAFGIERTFYVITAILLSTGVVQYISTISSLGVWLSPFIQAAAILGLVIWTIENEEENVKKVHQKLEDRAHTDALTQLKNRQWLEDKCEIWLDEIRKNDQALYIFFIDLDGFKLVNDKHGHKLGDALLMKIADILKALTSENDTICRLGGDEFLFISPNCRSAESALNKANNILLEVKNIDKIDNRTVRISCSIGIAMSHRSVNINELSELADKAMYVAKEKGKNNIQFA